MTTKTRHIMNGTDKLRRLVRGTVLLAAMLLGGLTAQATDYVITYTYNSTTYYIGMNGNSIQAKTSFDPTCIWTCRDGNNDADLSSSNSYSLRNKNNNSYFLTTTCSRSGFIIYSYTWGNLNVQTSANNIWRSSSATDGNVYARENSWGRQASIGNNGNALTMRDNNTGGSQNYKITSIPNSLIDETILPTISISSYHNNTITFGHDGLTGSYVPANSYTIYTFNGAAHNWYNSQDWGTAVPTGVSVNVSDMNPAPTYTWSLTANGGGVASINSSTGVLTIDGDPTGNITVRLTVSDISPLANKTATDFTLTRAAIAQNVTENTTLTTPTMSPTSASLNYNDYADFAASATATTTTTTTQAHVTLTGGGNTYYYCNGTLYTSTESFTSTETTYPTVSYAWSVTGAGSSNLSPASGSGSSIRITYSTPSASDVSATLTVTASAAGVSDKTASATITVLRTLPTEIALSEDDITLCTGASPQNVSYTLTPAGAYDNVTAESNNTSVVTVSSPNTGGSLTLTFPGGTGSAVITVTAATGVTATIDVTVRPYVVTPTISYNSSTHQIEISTTTPGADIYYTTDGSTPTTSSTHYTAPFTQSTAATIKAFAVKSGMCDSPVATKTLNQPATPVITLNSDNTVSITCATDGATIYYTSDGNTPSFSSITYSTAFDLPGSPVTIKAVAILEGVSSSVASSELTGTVPTPTIKINSSGNVTISANGSPADAEIRYTTDGSEPTPSSTLYSGAFNVASQTTVKAIAIKSGYSNSAVATKQYVVSGVSGSAVILNDLEDHSWSYYSDATLPTQLRSLNPADVKISYYGNGTNNISTTNGTTPANDSWIQSASTVKVGPSDNYNTFIYYKTLERTDGSTSDNPTGRCAYTAIPNPFSVRPTYQYATGNLNKYCGFYKWRVKTVSGGTIYDAATGGNSIGVGGTIDGDQTVYFAPGSEYGMEVELEALWARAYVKTGNANTLDANNTLVTNLSADTYERNFFVITAGNTDNDINKTQNPVTISCRYPDGTSGGSLNSTIKNNFTCNAATKIEYVTFNASSYTFNGNGKNFVIGRGCTGTVNIVEGISAAATNTFRFRIESGTYNKLYFMGASGVTTGHMTAVVGSDYDRANKTNSNLKINTDILLSNSGTVGTNATMGTERFHCTVKSGNFDLGSYGGDYQFYISSPGNSMKTYGKRVLVIEGGNFSDVSGGMEYGTVGDYLMVDMRIKGGTINGATYGAAQNSSGNGHRRMIITGGDFAGWIAGGANGTNTTGGQLVGDTYIYFGGKAHCDSKGSATTIGPGNATGGNIFGAGSGNASATEDATVGQVDNSTIVIADECYVEHNVYGGGNYGFVSSGSGHKSDIYILGGTVDGSVFGGSNNQKGQIVNITIKGGTVNNGLFGGSNSTGTVAGPVTIAMSGGTIENGLFGGGNGTTSTACNITGSTSLAISGGTVSGGVYGGGNTRSTIGNGVTISMSGGTVNDGLYGGGNGVNDNNCNCSVTGSTSLTISGGTVNGNVFGGGNTYSTISGGTTISMSNGSVNGKVFGGGNGIAARDCSIGTSTSTTITGGTITEGVYGGGNTNSTITQNATLQINGGTIGTVGSPANVHGGGYGAATVVSRNVEVTIGVLSTTGATIYGDVYGGSALGKVNGTSTNTTYHTYITLNAGTINGSLYGGALGNAETAAYVYSPVQVTVNGGSINMTDGTGENGSGAIFGCNNINGAPQSIVRVDVYGTDPAPSVDSYAIGAVFGGGNSADYSGTPVVTIHNCNNSIQYVFGGGNAARVAATDLTIWGGNTIGYVFGGGNGIETAANVTGNTSVTIRGGIIGHVFGGSNSSGSIGGSISVTIDKQTEEGHSSCDMAIGEVYGGGNMANSNVGSITIGCTGSSSSEYIDYVYGGANQANVTGDITLNITGGRINNVFGGNNAAGVIDGDITVNVNWSGSCGDNYLGNVYGGGNLAAYSEKTANHPAVNIINGTVSHNVYGGGKGITGGVTGNPVVTVGDNATAEVLGDVFGGGDAAAVTGNTKVEVKHTSTVGGNVFGGGNAAAVTGNTKVEVKHTSTVGGNVFGGGNAAAVSGGTEVLIKDKVKIYGNVYGGGDMGEVGGDTKVIVNGN